MSWPAPSDRPTLGKALGGASGGYVSGRRRNVDLLRQRSRPYLFSNSVAPPIAVASIAVLDLLSSSDELPRPVRADTELFRARMTAERFDILPAPTRSSPPFTERPPRR